MDNYGNKIIIEIIIDYMNYIYNDIYKYNYVIKPTY